jgi:signal transduction histidine kinase
VRAAGLDVVYRTAGAVEALDSGVQLTIYRIVQEALTNSLKHAGAGARVNLAIIAEPSRVTLRVQDTGADGDTRGREPVNEEGHGLVGMRERAALYRGSLRAGRDGTGWTVEAVLDLTPLDGAG